MKQYYSPTDSVIVGTLEALFGIAQVSGFDDNGAPQHSGGTTVDWDSQVTQTFAKDGSMMVVAEDGWEGPLSECTARDEEPT